MLRQRLAAQRLGALAAIPLVGWLQPQKLNLANTLRVEPQPVIKSSRRFFAE
jgi:hypothetical protein